MKLYFLFIFLSLQIDVSSSISIPFIQSISSSKDHLLILTDTGFVYSSEYHHSYLSNLSSNKRSNSFVVNSNPALGYKSNDLFQLASKPYSNSGSNNSSLVLPDPPNKNNPIPSANSTTINEDNNSISIIPEIIPTFIHELVVSNKHIVQITCGDSFSIALSNLGEVYSWGNGPEGQLGLGDIRFTYEPTVFILLVVSMHSCASLFFHTTSHQYIHVTIIQSVMTTIIICIPGVITSMDSWELETSRIAMSPTEYPSSLLFIVCRFLFIASRK